MNTNAHSSEEERAPGTKESDQGQIAFTTPPPSSAPHRLVEAWAANVIALAIATAHGEIAKCDAVDHLQAEAELAGLVQTFGQDEIQAALSLAFGAVWAPRPAENELRHVA